MLYITSKYENWLLIGGHKIKNKTITIKKKKTQQKTLCGEVRKKDKADKRNYLNDLTNTEWMFFTRSVWNTTYPHVLSHELRKEQGGNKPPGLMKDIIEFFTKSGEKVLDPTSGVGGTLLGCALSGRIGTGIELNPKWVDIYKKVCKENNIEEFKVLIGDSLEKIDELKGEKFAFIVMDPPYREDVEWDRTMCNNTHYTRDAGVAKKYSEDDKDLGNIKDAKLFLKKIYDLSTKIWELLDDNRYYVIFCKDEYQDEEYREKSSIITETIRKAGFYWKGKITWYQSGAKLRPYGVPYAYVPNIIDQKILIFKKKK